MIIKEGVPNLKFKFHSIVLYILLVILPTTGIGATFYSYHSYKMKQENKQVAHAVLFYIETI